MRIWEKSPGLTSYFLIFLFFSSSPSHSTFPCPFFFSLTLFLPPLDKNYTRIHSPELALCHVLWDWSQGFSVLLHCPPPVHFLFFLSPHFSFGSSFLFVHFFSFLSCFPFLSPFLSSSLSSSLSLPSFSLFFDFFPGPKTLWFSPPPPWEGKGDNRRIIIHPCKDVWILLMSVLKGFTMKLEKKINTILPICFCRIATNVRWGFEYRVIKLQWSWKTKIQTSHNLARSLV